MNGYVAFFNGQKAEFHADTLYAAKLMAVKHWKVSPRKQHLVSVHLCEKQGEQVVHAADF